MKTKSFSNKLVKVGPGGVAGIILNLLYMVMLLPLVSMSQSDLHLYASDSQRLQETLSDMRMMMGIILATTLIILWLYILKAYLKAFPQNTSILNNASREMRISIIVLLLSIVVHFAFYYYINNPTAKDYIDSANQLNLEVLESYIYYSGIAIAVTLVATFVSEKEIQRQLLYLLNSSTIRDTNSQLD